MPIWPWRGLIPFWHKRDMQKHFLRSWREHRSLTQEEAAEASGISQSVLTRIETGAREYKEHHLIALAVTYNCSPADLIGVNPLATIAQDHAEIVGIWGRIPQEKRPHARQILETFEDDEKREA